MMWTTECQKCFLIIEEIGRCYLNSGAGSDILREIAQLD